MFWLNDHTVGLSLEVLWHKWSLGKFVCMFGGRVTGVLFITVYKTDGIQMFHEVSAAGYFTQQL